MRKLVVMAAVLAGLMLNGCSIFYNVKYEDGTREINEYGMFGATNRSMAPKEGPFGLLPFMHDVQIKTEDAK